MTFPAFPAARRLAKDRSGAMAMTIALMITGFAGAAAMAVDVADWYGARRTMQSAADAAALGGAMELYEGGTVSQITTAATTDSKMNSTGLGSGATLSVTVNTSTGTVKATMTKKASLLFSAVLLGSAPTITTTAVAGMLNAGAPACLLTTNPTASGSLRVVGNGSISAPGCGIVVDSNSSSAMEINGGNGTITGDNICGPGGYTGSGFTPLPTSCGAMNNALAGLTPPSNVNDPCQYNNLSFSSGDVVTLNPGVYCGGIFAKANASVTMNPGVYVLRNGALTATGNATITGTGGVGIWMTGTGTTVSLENDDVSVTGNVNVNIVAPSSGPMAGIAIYQDASAATGTISNKLAGNGSVNFTGVLYFGNQDVIVAGNGAQDSQAPFTAFVANTLTYNGNGSLVLNANYSDTNVPLPQALRQPVITLLQ
jgi:Flp pilus assembly protein TadG